MATPAGGAKEEDKAKDKPADAKAEDSKDAAKKPDAKSSKECITVRFVNAPPGGGYSGGYPGGYSRGYSGGYPGAYYGGGKRQQSDQESLMIPLGATLTMLNEGRSGSGSQPTVYKVIEDPGATNAGPPPTIFKVIEEPEGREPIRTTTSPDEVTCPSCLDIINRRPSSPQPMSPVHQASCSVGKPSSSARQLSSSPEYRVVCAETSVDMMHPERNVAGQPVTKRILSQTHLCTEYSDPGEPEPPRALNKPSAEVGGPEFPDLRIRMRRRNSREQVAGKARSGERRQTSNPPMAHLKSCQRYSTQPSNIPYNNSPPPPPPPPPALLPRSYDRNGLRGERFAAERNVTGRTSRRSLSSMDYGPPPSYDSRPPSAEMIAREVWEQYQRDYREYLGLMEEWRNQYDRGSESESSRPEKPSRPQRGNIDLELEEEPVNIRIGMRHRRLGGSGSSMPGT